MAAIQSELTCRFTNLQVRGYCKILSWGGAEGFIMMTPFDIQEEEIDKGDILSLVKAKVNDGGFGAQSIISFHAMLDACYEHGARQYVVDEIFYNLKKDQLLDSKEIKEFDEFECC